jgi:hypothetical protein
MSSAAGLTSTTSTSTTSTTAPAMVAGSDCTASVSGAALGRAGWVASSNAPYNSSGPPADALDGNLATRFGTNEHQAPGLYFEVDLGAEASFDELVMQVPDHPTDYARGYDFETSANASSWTTVASCTGTSTSEVVSFPAQTAQFVKVVLTTATATEWWSIDELNLYGRITGTTASLASSPNPASVGGTVTYTATVVPVPNGGTISFFANGAPVPGCHNLGISTSTGEGTCSTTYTSVGRVGVQASYSGHATFGPSSSALYEEVINPPAPGYWLATQQRPGLRLRGGAVTGGRSNLGHYRASCRHSGDPDSEGLLGGHGQR